MTFKVWKLVITLTVRLKTKASFFFYLTFQINLPSPETTTVSTTESTRVDFWPNSGPVRGHFTSPGSRRSQPSENGIGGEEKVSDVSEPLTASVVQSLQTWFLCEFRTLLFSFWTRKQRLRICSVIGYWASCEFVAKTEALASVHLSTAMSRDSGHMITLRRSECPWCR